MPQFSQTKDHSRWVGLKELKEFKPDGIAKDAAEAKFTPVPMFLPTRTFGHTVASVITREKFIQTNIGWWLKYKLTRLGTIVFGIIAVVLIPINIVFAALCGIVAGYMYGTHKWSDFYVNQLLKNRRLLEST